MMDSPTVRRGFSERYGSWNTIWMRRRTGRSAEPDKVLRSSPPIIMWPAVGSIRRTMQRATVDFPEPDSPTMPRISPLRSVRLTSAAAITLRAAWRENSELLVP